MLDFIALDLDGTQLAEARLANAARDDPSLLAPMLTVYATRHELDARALADRLGCDGATLVTLGLCTAPPDDPLALVTYVKGVATALALDPHRLARALLTPPPPPLAPDTLGDGGSLGSLAPEVRCAADHQSAPGNSGTAGPDVTGQRTTSRRTPSASRPRGGWQQRGGWMPQGLDRLHAVFDRAVAHLALGRRPIHERLAAAGRELWSESRPAGKGELYDALRDLHERMAHIASIEAVSVDEAVDMAREIFMLEYRLRDRDD